MSLSGIGAWNARAKRFRQRKTRRGVPAETRARREVQTQPRKASPLCLSRSPCSDCHCVQSLFVACEPALLFYRKGFPLLAFLLQVSPSKRPFLRLDFLAIEGRPPPQSQPVLIILSFSPFLSVSVSSLASHSPSRLQSLFKRSFDSRVSVLPVVANRVPGPRCLLCEQKSGFRQSPGCRDSVFCP